MTLERFREQLEKEEEEERRQSRSRGRKSRLLPEMLDRDFDLIWAAPECRTWSRAAGGKYRNLDNIDGFPGREGYFDAQAAKREIQDLVDILGHYRRRNPSVVICVENPDGYLQKHAVSKRFKTDLGLRELRLSYCNFREPVEGEKATPRKNTILWTNAKKMQDVFRDDAFVCKNKCTGMTRCGRRHQQTVYDFVDNCSSYPKGVVEFWATLLYGEVMSRKRKD